MTPKTCSSVEVEGMIFLRAALLVFGAVWILPWLGVLFRLPFLVLLEAKMSVCLKRRKVITERSVTHARVVLVPVAFARPIANARPNARPKTTNQKP